MRYQNVIGIDPDCDKSGVAFLHTSSRKLEIKNLSFPLLLEYLKYCKQYSVSNGETYIVVVEAGWLNKKSCYHKAQGRGAEKIAKDVGANHETGRKIIEMCRYLGVNVDYIAPLRKCWKGPEGKITHKELAAFTGIGGRTNQDERDAALLAWCYANLPIRIKV